MEKAYWYMVATELAGIADIEEDGSDYKRHLKTILLIA